MVLAIWLYLIAARGRFWRAADRDDVKPGWVGPRRAMAFRDCHHPGAR